MNLILILYSSFTLASLNGTTTGPVTYEGLRNILASFANGINLTIEQNLTESEQRTLRNVKKEIDTISKEDLERQEKYFKTFLDIVKTSQNKQEDTKEKEKTSNPPTNPLQGLLPILANSLGSGNNNDLILSILCLLTSDQNSASGSNTNILTTLLPIILQRLNQRGSAQPANQMLLGNTGLLGACTGQNPLGANLQGSLLGLLGVQNIQGGINPAILQTLLGATTSPGTNLDPNQIILINVLLSLLNDNNITKECPLTSPPRPTSLYGPSLPQNGYGPSVPKNGYGPSVPEPPQASAAICQGTTCANGVETREYGRNYGRRP